MSLVDEAYKAYEDILKGKEGHWLDPGEYDVLKQEWFDKYALKLIESLRKCGQ